MDWLLSRDVVIALAILGGIFSVLATVLKGRPGFEPPRILLLNRISYVFMGASIILFIFNGLLGKTA